MYPSDGAWPFRVPASVIAPRFCVFHALPSCKYLGLQRSVLLTCLPECLFERGRQRIELTNREHTESREIERGERQREIYMYTREIGEFEFFLRGLWAVPMRNGGGGVRLLGV